MDLRIQMLMDVRIRRATWSVQTGAY